MTDPELIEAVAGGHVDALRILHERHAPWLKARLARRSSDASFVEDAIQDTFVAVWRNAGSYRDEGEVAAWIWGIAIRKLIDRLRRRRVPAFEPPAVVESAEDAVLTGIAFGEVGEAMARLSPELIEVVEARILDGLSTREAARLLGIPTGTVKTRLMKAKRVMREQLA
jgi:RNA polymerase sigma-70 factor (ECF subfamily)